MKKTIDIIIVFIILLLSLGNSKIIPIHHNQIKLSSSRTPLYFVRGVSGLYKGAREMNTKICRICKKEKSLNEFRKKWYKNQQKYYYSNQCKKCEKQYNKKYNDNHKEYYKKYYDNHKIVHKEYYKIYNKKYNQTEKGKLLNKKNAVIYRKKHPQRCRARYISRNAILSRKLIRQPCKVCGNPKSEGHHSDYSKPLEVIWLCKKHHIELHQKLKEVNNVSKRIRQKN